MVAEHLVGARHQRFHLGLSLRPGHAFHWMVVMDWHAPVTRSTPDGGRAEAPDCGGTVGRSVLVELAGTSDRHHRRFHAVLERRHQVHTQSGVRDQVGHLRSARHCPAHRQSANGQVLGSDLRDSGDREMYGTDRTTNLVCGDHLRRFYTEFRYPLIYFRMNLCIRFVVFAAALSLLVAACRGHRTSDFAGPAATVDTANAGSLSGTVK